MKKKACSQAECGFLFHRDANMNALSERISPSIDFPLKTSGRLRHILTSHRRQELGVGMGLEKEQISS